MESAVMSRFAGGLLAHIDAYYLDSWLSSHGIIDDRPPIIYSIPNSDYISEHWREIHFELMTKESVREYSDKLKEVAKQYLPLFLQEYPEYKDEKCLRVE